MTLCKRHKTKVRATLQKQGSINSKAPPQMKINNQNTLICTLSLMIS